MGGRSLSYKKSRLLSVEMQEFHCLVYIYFGTLDALTMIPHMLYIHIFSSSFSTRELAVFSPIIPGKPATKE